MKIQDSYDSPTTINFPGMVVNLYRPILIDEERTRRIERIKSAAFDLLFQKKKELKNEKSLTQNT